jgi:hypothetical protein
MEKNLLLRKEASYGVDEGEIDAQYRFAHIAVRMVLWYDESLLEPVKKIGNLPSGAYGVYRTEENEKILPQDIKESIKLMTGNPNATDQTIAMIPTVVLRQFMPNMNIIREDTIRVNVPRTVSELSDDWHIVRELASTIVHESTHVKEWEETGATDESGPTSAEQAFQMWADVHEEEILNAFPELKQAYEAEMPQQNSWNQ